METNGRITKENSQTHSNLIVFTFPTASEGGRYHTSAYDTKAWPHFTLHYSHLRLMHLEICICFVATRSLSTTVTSSSSNIVIPTWPPSSGSKLSQTLPMSTYTSSRNLGWTGIWMVIHDLRSSHCQTADGLEPLPDLSQLV